MNYRGWLRGGLQGQDTLQNGRPLDGLGRADAATGAEVIVYSGVYSGAE